MEYKKIEKDGYILGLALVPKNGNITEEEYHKLTDMFHNMPTASDGYRYRLTAGLEWELSEIPVNDPAEEEISEAEALAILLGGAV